MTSIVVYAAGVGEQIPISYNVFVYSLTRDYDFYNFISLSGSNEEEEGKKHGPHQV